MHCARPVTPRTTKATVRFGSSSSPPVTSSAAALVAALVAEPASRPAGKQQPLCTRKSPRLCPGALFLRTATSQARRVCSFQRGSLVADDLLQEVAAGRRQPWSHTAERMKATPQRPPEEGPSGCGAGHLPYNGHLPEERRDLVPT